MYLTLGGIPLGFGELGPELVGPWYFFSAGSQWNHILVVSLLAEVPKLQPRALGPCSQGHRE